MAHTCVSIPEIPDDVKQFIELAKKRGYDVSKVAVARVPFERYYYYEDGEYVGEIGEEVALEPNIVMAHDDICVLFYNDEPVLAMARGKQAHAGGERGARERGATNSK